MLLISPNRSSNVLFCFGGTLLVSGFGHLLVLLINGGGWEGETSLRKPILFGISGGVTLLSIGWIVPKIRSRDWDQVLWISFGLAMVIEVALITLQHWRGVPSHFNRSTPIDAAILNTAEVLILFVTIVIGDLTWRSLRDLSTSSDMRPAIQAGLVLLFFGCLLGVLATVHGARQQTLGRPPGVYGEAGVMKFAHGMPLHAIQILPALCWTMRQLRVSESDRRMVVLLSVGALVTLMLFSIVQTFSGRSRFDLTLMSALLLVLSAMLPTVGLLRIVMHRAATGSGKRC